MDVRTQRIRKRDSLIRARLRSASRAKHDYWSFRHTAERGYAQACFQYPAMMVPEMLGVLIDSVLAAVPGARTLYETFIGSGTAMSQAMLRGLDVVGRDVNPLAVLLCLVKAGPFFKAALEVKIIQLRKRIIRDQSSRIDIEFDGRDKWFRKDVLIGLSRIRRAIREEESLWARRFFWVAIAETVRLTSNSRTTTFKLHTRPEDEILHRTINVTQVFDEVLTKHWEQFLAQRTALQERGFLERDRYIGKIRIDLRSAAATVRSARRYDFLVTSPSYGDNRTTVPYGQHSYLPLQWIDLEDIDNSLDYSCLDSTLEIDRRSLGGSVASALESKELLCELSTTFKRTLKELEGSPRDAISRVCAFWRDLDGCINPTLKALKPNAYMIWIVGNRRVAGHVIPMDRILYELLAARGARPVENLLRTIPTKRMALRNSVSSTMRGESVLVMRKGQ